MLTITLLILAYLIGLTLLLAYVFKKVPIFWSIPNAAIATYQIFNSIPSSFLLVQWSAIIGWLLVCIYFMYFHKNAKIGGGYPELTRLNDLFTGGFMGTLLGLLIVLIVKVAL